MSQAQGVDPLQAYETNEAIAFQSMKTDKMTTFFTKIIWTGSSNDLFYLTLKQSQFLYTRKSTFFLS